MFFNKKTNNVEKYIGEKTYIFFSHCPVSDGYKQGIFLFLSVK